VMKGVRRTADSGHNGNANSGLVFERIVVGAIVA
jgi:hypothetical protein